MSSRKLKNRNVNEKLKIVNAIKSGKSRQEVMTEFNVPQATLCRMIKNATELEDQARKGHGRNKRIKKAEYPLLEESLVTWMKECRHNNVPIGGNLIKEKAKKFALSLGIKEFSVSNGWLDGFKKRNDIVFRKICGESSAVDSNLCSEWMQGLEDLTSQYSDKDIFNADETALFYKCLPDKTFEFRESDCRGGKKSKDRVTILLCTNMNGTEKLPILLIGKSAKPRCLKNIKSLPVEYKHNKKAWMTTSLFQEWLIKIDKEMSSMQRKILLFVDNCSAHKNLPVLCSITIKFLPANTTSKLQPLDQGIIHNFKVFYRKQLIDHILSCIDEGSTYEVNLLHAMRFSRRAWQDVSNNTIENCFKKCGFKTQALDNCLEEIVELENPPNWETLCSNNTNNEISFKDYINVDQDLPVCGVLTDEDIILAVSEKSDEENIDYEEITVEKPTITMKEARKALDVVQDYFEMNPGTDQRTFTNIHELQKLINTSNKTIQTKLTDFF